jgi:acyl-CoA synthetase (AMP-forming)/AMP-acid ligase II
VFGVPHATLGEVVVAEIVPHPGIVVPLQDVTEYCAERLSTYKVPSEIRIVDFLPLTDSGKIVRSA